MSSKKIALIVGCDEPAITAHGVSKALVEQRVEESLQALEDLRQALMQVTAAPMADRQTRWEANPTLVRWFGKYSKRGTIMLYSRCQRIMATLRNSIFTIKCSERLGGLMGRGGVYQLVLYAAVWGTYTQEEQIAGLIHETGHPVVAGADFKYYESKCLTLAQKHPAIARVNLDNLAYCALECGGYVI